MADENTILSEEAAIVRALQLTIRGQLDVRGMSLKAIAFDSGLSYSTVLSYFPGERNAVPNAIPVAALRRLTGVIPADLLSLLLPDGWQIVRAPESIDHDALCDQVVDYLARKQAAHHPESENGVAIGPTERAELDSKVVQIKAAA